MRVLQVLHQPIDGSSIGGTESHVRDLVGALDPNRFESWVAYSDEHCLFAEHWVNGECIDRLAVVHDLGAPGFHVRNSGLSPYLRDLMLALRIDLLHQHHGIHISYEPLAVAHELGIPSIVSVHDARILDLEADAREALSELLAEVGAVVFPSQFLAREVSPVVAVESPLVIEHGIRSCSTSSSETPETFHVVFLGSTHLDEKGRELIEQLAPRLLAAGIQVSLLGAAQDFLNEWRGNPGFVNHGPYARDDLPSLLADMRPSIAAILSLAHEAFGFTLAEAWRSGLPVVATNVGALPERVEASGAGVVISPGDADAAFDAIVALQTDSEELERLRKRARATPVRELIDEVAELTRAYESVADRVPARCDATGIDLDLARRTASELVRLRIELARRTGDQHAELQSHRRTHALLEASQLREVELDRRLRLATRELQHVRATLDGSRTVRLLRFLKRLAGHPLPADWPSPVEPSRADSNHR